MAETTVAPAGLILVMISGLVTLNATTVINHIAQNKESLLAPLYSSKNFFIINYSVIQVPESPPEVHTNLVADEAGEEFSNVSPVSHVPIVGAAEETLLAQLS